MRRGGRAAARVVLGILVLVSQAAASGFDDPGWDPMDMLAWATAVDEADRGPMDIAFPGDGDASFGVEANVLGVATGGTFDVYSLGDGGFITLFFDAGIQDDPGDDFAVYENGFFSLGGLFAEFAFVEVSSNGDDFARFPSETLRTTPVAGGGVVDPTDYACFAGDQMAGLGTGFDLADLAGEPEVIAGDVDLSDIAYVRVVDVIGNGSEVDSTGAAVYDPYPTPFSSSGFDLEAIGVIHPVPEPGSAGMLAAGSVLLVRLARRRTGGPCRDPV